MALLTGKNFSPVEKFGENAITLATGVRDRLMNLGRERADGNYSVLKQE